MTELTGHQAIVTGGGAGIGAATARRLVGLGAAVAVLDRDGEAATAIAEAARRDPTTLRAIDTDLHHRITDWRAIAPFVPEGHRHRVNRSGGPPMARHAYRMLGVSDPEAVAAAGDPGNPARLADGAH